jgi:hypothetical protein
VTDVAHIRYGKAAAFEGDPELGAGSYRVFIGMWDDDGEPDWVHVDRRFEAWEDALTRWRGDGCYVCARTGAEELDRLASVGAGAPFEGSVEGEDFLILVDAGEIG